MHGFYICQDDFATMWQLGDAPEKCTYLTNILTFYLVKLMQDVQCHFMVSPEL